jgi:hypothetical protein
MAAKVGLPTRWISAITARVMALASVARSLLAARASCRLDATGRAKLQSAALGRSKSRLCPLAD